MPDGTTHCVSKRSQKVQDDLLLRLRERVEAHNHRVGLRRAVAGRMGRIFAIACGCKMRMDGLQKVIRAPVVEEESALAHSPQRRGAEHIPVAAPCVMSSARPLPIWCISKSE